MCVLNLSQDEIPSTCEGKIEVRKARGQAVPPHRAAEAQDTHVSAGNSQNHTRPLAHKNEPAQSRGAEKPSLSTLVWAV